MHNTALAALLSTFTGPVIYKSKLPAPSVSMPCDYRILQSSTKGQVKLVLHLRPCNGLKEDISKPKDKRKVPSCAGLLVGLI